MADIDPQVKRKEIDELVTNGRKLLGAAVVALLAKIESGEATAADMNAAARLCDLLGLDRLIDLRDENHSRDLLRQLEELDNDDANSGGSWPDAMR